MAGALKAGITPKPHRLHGYFLLSPACSGYTKPKIRNPKSLPGEVPQEPTWHPYRALGAPWRQLDIMTSIGIRLQGVRNGAYVFSRIFMTVSVFLSVRVLHVCLCASVCTHVSCEHLHRCAKPSGRL